MPAREAVENLRHVHNQDGDWRAAEQDIIASREAVQRTRPPGWAARGRGTTRGSRDRRRLASRLASCDRPGWQALGKLVGGEEIRHYQALWHYILASWAIIAARADQDRWLKVADTHFAAARAAAEGTHWLAGLITSVGQLITGLQPDVTNPVDAAAIHGIAASRLRTMPGTKFAAAVQAVTGGLA